MAKKIAPCLVNLIFFSSVLFSVEATASSKRRIPIHLIREINHDGPYIGLITVYPPEEAGFFATEAFEPHQTHPFVDLSGRRFRVGKVHGKRVIFVKCGVGMVNAAAATQQMVDMFDIKGIIHFGIAGNVNNSMSIGDVTIPEQFAHTGIWDWMNPNGTLPTADVAELRFGSYNIPKGKEMNKLGHIGYNYEQFFSLSGKPNRDQPLFWVPVTRNWLHLASNLKGLELEQCVNSSFCLPRKPKLVMGLRGSTANIFVDNAAYRDFLYKTFGVSSVDMESSAVVMTSLSNGCPVIVIRGLSDLAGNQKGQNPIQIFGPLAATNAAKAVVQFVKILPQ